MKQIALLFLILLTGCSFAPQRGRPPMSTAMPAHYKEVGPWIKLTEPTAFKANQRDWWTLYQDKTLNQLESDVCAHNKNIKIAFARYQKALDILEGVRSAEYPNILGIGSGAKQQGSKNISDKSTTSYLYDTFLLGALLNYELDAWGRVRNSVIASDNQATASEFDLATITLSMQTMLAKDYFKLRGADEALRVLDKRVAVYQKALYLIKERYHKGIVPIAAVDEAIIPLETAKAETAEIRLTRAKLEHAMAVLLGDIPGNFSLPPQHTPIHCVVVAPYLPATLLVKRPDIAAAERRVQAANANIGVARAAFFPQINLQGIIGYQSRHLSNLFSTPSFFWALGPPTTLTLIQPEIAQVLFDGFKLQSQLRYAKAHYVEAVETYRQAALTAFQEVEDALVSLRRLDEEAQTLHVATTAANRALYQAQQRYKGEIITFLGVVPIENIALQSELSLINIKVRRQVSSVQLIQALGGGWN